MVSLVLYQPDIPQNAGSVLRLGACLGITVEIVEPAGFHLSDRHLKRAGMDYLDHVRLVRHRSWQAFQASLDGRRLVLASAHAARAFTDFTFEPGDALLLGRESAGVPADVAEAADHRILIPMRPGLRSINVAQAAAMIAGEALRQLDAFPVPE